MALPKLNDNPQYQVAIPSTGQVVNYRPYLVKEEKVLMLAMESNDEKHMFNALVNTIEACVDEQIDKKSLTTFDIEYLFTQIRSKSVGESSTLNLKCTECGELTEVSVNLEQIKVDIPEVNDTIQLTDDVSIKMRWPTYMTILDADTKGKSDTEQTFEMILGCIESVMTEDENIVMADESKMDQLAFIESLNTKQFGQIRDFMQEMPAMKHDVNYDCASCGHHNELQLKGMSDFF